MDNSTSNAGRLSEGTVNALTSGHTSPQALRRIADYAEFLTTADLPDAARLAGVVTRAFALAALATLDGEESALAESRAAIPIFHALANTPGLPESLHERASRYVSRQCAPTPQLRSGE